MKRTLFAVFLHVCGLLRMLYPEFARRIKGKTKER